MNFSISPSILLVAACLAILAHRPACAKDSANTMSLRSPEIDNGTQKWLMQQVGKEKVDGTEISKPSWNPKGWMPAIVPGTVLNSLVANGVYPEPYYGLNNANELKKIPDLSETGPEFYTYWFRTEFTLPKAFSEKRVILQFNGINYRADIWLNGTKLGEMAGMFNRGYFDVTDIVNRKGKNALAVLVKPVDVPGGFRKDKKKADAIGENANGGDGRIGKNTTMLMSVGWDFTFMDGIRDRNTGIWQDVELLAVGDVALRNPFVKTKLPLPDTSSSSETVIVEAINLTDQPKTATVKVVVPEAGTDVKQDVELAPKETKEVTFTSEEFPSLVVKDPKLWWPFNKGDQHLYDMTVEAEVKGTVSQKLADRFGIREITSNRDTPDKSRMFYVNGKRFFVRGSNWIPEAMLRMSDSRTEAELRYTKQAGVNFLRLWGGGIAESDRFYEMCDELGIIVWTEFWITGNTDKPEDAELYRANVADTIKRLRNHASQGYWVSANEKDDVIPIKDLVDSLDGTRGYQIQSEREGIHDGSPYLYVNPMFYYDDTASPRGSRINGFCPEYGAPCLPTIDGLREMMDEKDLWPINKVVWTYLDGNGFHKVATDLVEAVDQYGTSKSIEEFAKKAQMVGAASYRGVWENWNYNRYEFGNRFASGVLFWYHNSPARQVAGRMWDWSLEPTAALYFSQDALEPIHAQIDFIKNTVTVNNELMKPLEGAHVRARVFDSDMKLRLDEQKDFDVAADSVANDLLTLDLPDDLSPVHFIRLDISDKSGAPIADTFYWRSNNKYQGPNSKSGPLYGGFEAIKDLPKVKLHVDARRTTINDRPALQVRIKNADKSLAFMVQLKLLEKKTGKPIRPTFYSDNFVSLFPGEEKTIVIDTPQSVPDGAELFFEGWNVDPVSAPVAALPKG